MAAFNIFDQFYEDIAHGVHTLNTDTLRLYLSNATPSASADAVKADLAEIAGGNGYTAGGETVTVASSAQTAGLYQLTVNDITWNFTGSVGPFRYVVMYNDSTTSPLDALIGWADYGSSQSFGNGDSFTVDFNPTTGIIRLS